jgi:hypothetical protein
MFVVNELLAGKVDSVSLALNTSDRSLSKSESMLVGIHFFLIYTAKQGTMLLHTNINTATIFIGVPVPSQESKKSCMLVISILAPFFGFSIHEIVPTVWYF